LKSSNLFGFSSYKSFELGQKTDFSGQKFAKLGQNLKKNIPQLQKTGIAQTP
jgi:hypothetical protein